MNHPSNEGNSETFYRRLISMGLPKDDSDSHDEAMNELCETRLEANRFGCVVALIVVSFGFLPDFFYYPEQAATFAAIRIPALIVLAGLWIVQGEGNPRRWQYLPLTVFLLASAISWIVTLMVWNLKGGDSPYFGGFMLVLMGMAFVMRVSPIESATYGIYMLGQYVFAAWAHANNLWGFAVDMPADAQASLADIITGNTLFPVGIFFIAVATLLCTIGAVLITSESFSRLLEKANAKRSREDLMRFVAMASHEIKTPVQYLLTFSEHLMKSPAASTDPDFAKIQVGIEQQTNRLLNELRKLSEVTRLEGMGSVESDEDPKACCSFNSALDSVLLDVQPACQITGIDLVFSPLEERIWVPGTIDDLTLILNNVINNAVKFTETGGRIIIKPEFVNGSHLKVAISDNGSGMTEKQLGILFEPFRQGGSKTMSRHFGGFGLGMYLSKTTIDGLGGSIGADSIPGVGTTITLTFPVVDNSDINPDQMESRSSSSIVAQAAATKHSLGHYSYEVSRERMSRDTDNDGVVLIVDDEVSIHDSIALILSRWNCVHAISGQEALRAVEEIKPNVVIMDVMLPGMDGIETIRRICANNSSNATQIIVSSALLNYESKPLLRAAIDEGARDVINKPFSSVELEQRVRSHMTVSQLTLRLEKIIAKLKITQTQLLQSEKLRTISILTDGLLHNIGNPLSSSLNTFSALSEKYSGDAKVAKHFKNGMDSLRSVASQIQALKNYSHPKGGSVKESVLVASLFDRALDVVGIKDTRIKINRSFEVDQIECNSLYVTQILVTFLLNAKDALRNSATPVIDIGIKQHSLNGISKFDLFVSDNGPGISQDEPLFDAYYTGKDVGEGSGLGLYVASIMAEETGSLLLAENNHLGGALFAIRMNAARSESTPVAYQ